MRFFFILAKTNYVNPIYNILSYLAVYITLIPFIIGFFTWRFFTRSEKNIFILIGLSVITEITSTFYGEFLNSKNISILNIYIILETILICIFYYTILLSKILKLIIILVTFGFVLISIYLILINDRNIFNNVSFTIESIIVTVLALLTFNDLLRNTLYPNILSAPVFWFNCGFLLFFSGNLILHLFSRFLQAHAQHVLYELWGFHSALNIIFYILISIGFWKTRTLRT